MSAKVSPHFTLPLPPLNGATAAWIIDLCGHLQTAIWLAYGDEIESHWAATDPSQPIYGRLQPTPTPPRKR